MSPQPMRRRTLLSALAAGAAAATAGVTLPAEAQAKPCRAAKTGPVTVAYVEVNDHSMLNVGKYTLANGGGHVIDVAVIFAANINYDGTNGVPVLQPERAERARQRRHPGPAAAAEGHQGPAVDPRQPPGRRLRQLPVPGRGRSPFAKQLADTVNQYGLDGIDFDDEYAEYGNNGTGQPNDCSFVYLVPALRAKLPNKLITLYDIGPAADRLYLRRRRASPTRSTTPGTRTTAPGASRAARRQVAPLPGRRVIHRDELVRPRPPSPSERSAKGTASS